MHIKGIIQIVIVVVVIVAISVTASLLNLGPELVKALVALHAGR